MTRFVPDSPVLAILQFFQPLAVTQNEPVFLEKGPGANPVFYTHHPFSEITASWYAE